MNSKKGLWHSRILLFLVIFQAAFAVQLLVSHFFPETFMENVHDFSIWLDPMIGLVCLLYLVKVNRFLAQANRTNDQQLDHLNSQRHDFMNHLQTIIGFIQLQKTPAALTYAREVVLDLVKGDLKGETTEETLEALLIGITEYAARRGVSVRFSLCPQPIDEIPLPAPHLNRLVGNLLHNAIDAVESLGVEHRQVDFNLELRNQEWQLEVSNPGPPIPAATLEKIFNPGFSTKAKTGRGLGLSTVRNITQSYGGKLFVESNAKVGTRFTVVIPQAKKDLLS
ncbi:MAG TPA: ATP-binding protein [Bacillota bacterium]|nr:ATP-binding protein [Bacillota bacterium]